MSAEAGGSNVAGEEPVSEPVVETEAATVTENAELERTLGLGGWLAIGVGTMIGAGIFVFPGLAAGNAGPAAAASFGIGAVVALLVALPASELAPAMPKSGGGYYFISRGLGALAGAVVGLSLWFGLVFATAFYLVGFGFYAVDALAEVGVAVGEGWVIPVALLFGAGFTVLNVTGTEKAAKLQNRVVALLLSILVVFLGFGVLDALGMAGGPILLLTATGRVELLAEVASFLHLVMYGLTCVALIALRRDEPDWYDPDFRVPGYPAVPAVGAVASFGLIAFMQPLSQVVGLLVMIATAGWDFYYARDVRLKGAL
jgi:amino acid transporter